MLSRPSTRLAALHPWCPPRPLGAAPPLLRDDPHQPTAAPRPSARLSWPALPPRRRRAQYKRECSQLLSPVRRVTVRARGRRGCLLRPRRLLGPAARRAPERRRRRLDGLPPPGVAETRRLPPPGGRLPSEAGRLAGAPPSPPVPLRSDVGCRAPEARGSGPAPIPRRGDGPGGR